MNNQLKLCMKIFIVSLLFIIVAVFWWDNSKESHRIPIGYQDGAGFVTRLRAQLQKAEPRSPEAWRLTRLIDEVQRKASTKYQTAEDPGAFLQALTEIKTAWDGKTYEHNYKIDELRKAKTQSLRKTINLPWVERGPGNVSGRARAIIVDPDDPGGNTWFMASVGGGIWKTTNAGATWENKTPTLTTLSTMTMAMAESNHDVIYAGTGMGYGRIVDLAGSGVWKSTDHGETWVQLQSTTNGQILQAVNRIVVDPRSESIVLVCSNDPYSWDNARGGTRRSGIFRSTDGGDSWTQVYDPDAVLGTLTDNRVQQIIANPKNFNTLYATVNEVGVIKSPDAGLSWFVSADDFALPQDIGQGDGTYRGISVRTEIAISPSDTSRLYAAVERPYGVADLYMTDDAGVNWRLVHDTGDDPNWFNAFERSGADGNYTSGWFDNTIVVHPYDRNVVFVGGVNMFRIDVDESNFTRTTTIAADHWGRYPGVSFVHGDHHFFVTIPENEETGQFRIVNANDGGVGYSNDGGRSWVHLTGQVTTQFYGVDKKPGENVYIGGMQDNGTYHSPPDPDRNSQWMRDLGGDGFEAAWNYSDPNLVLGGSQRARLSRSTDGGLSWYRIPESNPGDYNPFITKIASSKIDPDLVFTVGSNGVMRSDDFGLSWTLTSIQDNWLGFRAFDNVEISLSDPQIVWISSRIKPDTFYGSRGGVHVSVDGGLSFTEISQNLPVNVTEASGIGTHPLNPNTAFLLFSAPDNPKILQTTDLGQTWEDLSGFGSGSPSSSNGFPDVAVFSLLVMPYDADILWAGTEIGLFVSENGGQSWRFADNGFPAAGIFEMKIVDGQIVVATQGRGIWTVDLPELSDYRPPQVTLSPRLSGLHLHPAGYASVKVDLPSVYDSTHVIMDGTVFVRLGANATTVDTTFAIIVEDAGTIRASVVSYKNERFYRSPEKSIAVFPTHILNIYSNNLNDASASQDFIQEGLEVTTVDGFNSPALHSSHPYPNGDHFIATLKQPVRVAHENAILQYSDIAIVEPGDSEAVFGDVAMFDYVVVEGSNDGLEWRAVEDGYDARANTDWLAAYNTNAAGNPSMFVTHRIDLLQTFEPDDIIFLRYRLIADGSVNGWGWVVDDIEIQSSIAVQEIPDEFQLAQNYPNPFNLTTTILYGLPEPVHVKLKIYNALGQEILTLIDDNIPEGTRPVEWDGTDKNGRPVASGLYFYTMEAGNYRQSKKMILVK